MLWPSSASRAPRWSGSGSSVRRAPSSRMRPLQQPPAEVAQSIERCRVAPVEIVDEHDAGPVVERIGDQPADRLEKVLARARLVEAGRRRGAEVGKQARRIAAQRLRDGVRIGADRGAQQLRDDAVGESALAGVRPGRQHAGAAARQRADRLLGEAGLADARLTFDHHDRPVIRDRAEGVDDAAQLGAAADQRQLVRLRHRLGDHRLELGSGADRAVQLGRLGQRLHAELAAQHAHAVPILGERVAAPARGRVELDQLAVRRLVQPVELEPLLRPGDGFVEATFARQPLDQPVERRGPLAPHRVLGQPLPVVEVDAVAQPEAGEQVIAMEVTRRGQGRDRRIRIGRRASGTRRGRTTGPWARGRPSRRSLSSRPSPSAVRSVDRVRRSADRERSGSASGQSRFATTARVWVCPVTARYASIAVALRVSTDSGCPSTSMRGAPRSEILSGFKGHSMSGGVQRDEAGRVAP